MYEDVGAKAVAHMAGNASLGNANHQNRTLRSPDATPKDTPLSIVHTERLFACMSELQILLNRVENAADRLAGSVPQAEAAGQEQVPPVNLSDRLAFAVSVNSQLLSRLRQEIERIERFV